MGDNVVVRKQPPPRAGRVERSLTPQKKPLSRFQLAVRRFKDVVGTALEVPSQIVSDLLDGNFKGAGAKLAMGVGAIVGAPVESYQMVAGSARKPFVGSEEEARKRGYEYYMESKDSEYAMPVSYPVTIKRDTVITPMIAEIDGQKIPFFHREVKTPSKREVAKNQMENHGITQEHAQDKSKTSRTLYRKAPAYSYNVFQLIDNMRYGQDVMDEETMQPVKGDIDTSRYQKTVDGIIKVASAIGLDDQKVSMLRTLSKPSTKPSKTRADLRNLYFGYPVQNGTIEVSDYDGMGKGKFENEYAFRFKNKEPFTNPAYKSVGNGQVVPIADGYNMGRHTISRSDDGSYTSYYDNWDLNPMTILSESKSGNLSFMGKGFDLYDRKERFKNK